MVGISPTHSYSYLINVYKRILWGHGGELIANLQISPDLPVQRKKVERLYIQVVGWLAGRLFVRRDIQTRTNMSLDCLWTVSGLSLDCLWTVS